jgi:hypothetical protein
MVVIFSYQLGQLPYQHKCQQEHDPGKFCLSQVGADALLMMSLLIPYITRENLYVV